MLACVLTARHPRPPNPTPARHLPTTYGDPAPPRHPYLTWVGDVSVQVLGHRPVHGEGD